KALWRYYVEPPESIWRYDVGAPRNLDKTLFEKENVHWQTGDWWNEFDNVTKPYSSDWSGDRPGVTSENALAHRLTIRPRSIAESASSSSIIVTDEINTVTGGAYRAEEYDSSRPVVVAVEGIPVDASKYTVEWLVEGEWIETDAAPQGATKSRISFEDSVFVTGASGTSLVEIYWPAQALLDYDIVQDKGKLLISEGNFSMDAGVTYSDRWAVEEPLLFPSSPTLTSLIRNTDEGALEAGEDGRYTTHWAINNLVLGPATTEGHSARTVLTLDPLYDPQTFALEDGSPWQIDKIEGRTVTLKTIEGALLNPKNAEWTFGNAAFTVKTIANPYSESGTVSGTITSDTTLTYPAVGSSLPGGTTPSSTSSASARVNSRSEASAYIAADQRRVEISDALAWTAYVSMGRIPDSVKWVQEIKLPTDTDIAYMNEVNATNGYDPAISIDPATGLDTTGRYSGIGRSKYEGSYTLSEVTVTNAPAGSKIVFSSTAGGAGVTKTIDANGAVDLTGIPADTKFMRIEAQGNTSAAQTAGAQIHFTITPRDNRTADAYVAWLSPTQDPVSGKRIQAWPDYSRVVSSQISGIVWNDQDKDTRIGNGDAPEKRYSGVHVVLQTKDQAGKWTNIPGRETTTNDKGEYSFTGLHSGDYRVVLPKVERKDASTEVSTINGSSDGADGDLKASATNRFNVKKQTEQTRSGRKIFTSSSSTIEVRLGIDARSSGHDYGYYTPNADLGLDKSPASVKDNGNGTLDLTWTIDVKNSGNTTLRDLTLNDRTSSEVFNVKATTSFKETGEIFGAIGMNPLAAGGSGVWTSEGYSIVRSDGSASKALGISGTVMGVTGLVPVLGGGGSGVWTNEGYWLVGSDGRTTKASGISGTILGAIGSYPIDQQGSAVWTSEGYWLVGSDGRTTKASGISGTILGAIGTEPLSSGGSAVWTSEGYWLVSQDGVAKKVSGITGSVFGATGTKPLEDTGSAVWTSEGYWVVGLNGPQKITGVSGEIHGAVGEHPATYMEGSGVWTSEGYWLVDLYEGATRSTGLSGTVLGAEGAFPLAANNASGVWTSEGYWVVASDGRTKRADAIEGTILGVIGVYPDSSTGASGVWTTKGYWLVDSDGSATKIEGLTGILLGATGQSPKDPSYGSGVWTSDGYWLVDPYTMRANLVLPVPSQTFDAQVLTASSQIAETALDQSSWVNRSYTLPMALKSGQTARITVSGTVRKQNVKFWVGNQAWTTSAETPREGITAYSGVAVTGQNMAEGVPQIPVLAKTQFLNAEGIFNNTTSGTNSAPGIELENRPVDDLSDQTPAKIPAADDILGGLSGVVWYDEDGNNQRDDADRRVEGMKVLITDLDGNPLGEAYTKADGSWKVTGIPEDTKVIVRYASTGWQGNDKNGVQRSWAPVRTGDLDPHSAADSDSDTVGIVNEGRGAQSTYDIQSGYADLGLRTIDAQIALVKGAIKDTADKAEMDAITAEDELDEQLATPTPADPLPTDIDQLETPGRVDDADHDPRTQAYTFTYANTGSEKLTHVKLSDTTDQGNPAVLARGVLVKRATDATIIQAKLDADGVLVDDAGAEIVLEPGDKVLGRYAIAFTAGAPAHTNTLKVTAGITPDGTSIVGEVSDSDPFSAAYETVPPRTLILEKADGDTAQPLKNAVLTVQKTALGELPTGDPGNAVVAGEIGTFITDSTGRIPLSLKSGVYRILEKNPPVGYAKPSGVWYVQLSYGADGEPRLLVMATQGQPGASVDAQPSDGAWGRIRLTNDKVPGVAIPMTGGRAADTIYAAALVLALIAALGAAVKKRRETQTRAYEAKH
ncbi:SpaA isopeptide-forming pilin-related protein, partial [Schaalia hyovaginalis]|uniref:SpaA isopeptide-forming pilin-related protein n=1 Tax=Schaalia hyovaginalis TaxID=29316 RepID=UPI002A83A169